MENLDKHYLALGLQRGATQEEIRSAFRQMVEQYHPDKDSSLDAQMKYHEAQQAYAALSIPAEPSFPPDPPPNAATRSWTSGSSNSTGGARQQTAYNYGSAGFTNPSTNTKKDTTNRVGFNDSVKNHPEFKELFKSYARVEPEEADEFSDFPLRGYFSRWELVLTVIGSIVVTFMAMRYLTAMTFTNESSVRLFWHTAVFVSVSWLIFWFIRFTHPSPSRGLSFTVSFFLAIAYACWICLFALWPEFNQFLRSGVLAETSASVPIGYFFKFLFIFTVATLSLEKEGFQEGLRIAFSIFHGTGSARKRN